VQHTSTFGPGTTCATDAAWAPRRTAEPCPSRRDHDTADNCPSFRFPTTAALAQGRLLVVNSQFNDRNSPEPFTVSSIERP
jgi:hypothetical protein